MKLLYFVMALILFMAGSSILKVPFYDTDSIGLVYMVKGIALGIMVLALILFLKVFKTKE